MVIDKVHVESVPAFKPENNPPVRADSRRKKAFQLTSEAVQAESRHVHAFNLLCGVQGRKNEVYPLQHVRRQFAAVVILEEPPQTFVPKGFYHEGYCKAEIDILQELSA